MVTVNAGVDQGDDGRRIGGSSFVIRASSSASPAHTDSSRYTGALQEVVRLDPFNDAGELAQGIERRVEIEILFEPQLDDVALSSKPLMGVADGINDRILVLLGRFRNELDE